MMERNEYLEVEYKRQIHQRLCDFDERLVKVEQGLAFLQAASPMESVKGELCGYWDPS